MIKRLSTTRNVIENSVVNINKNSLIAHFFSQIFAYIAKKQYFCTRFSEQVVLISLRSNDLLPALQSVAGSSSARLECLLWEQEVVSSNLAYPTESHRLSFL